MRGDKGGAGLKGHRLIAEGGGAGRADLCKGQTGSSSFKQFTWTGFSWGKKNLFVPLINSSFLPVSCLHLSRRKLVNILSSSPSAYVNPPLISNSLIMSTFVMWVSLPLLSLLNASPCHSFPLTAPAKGPCCPRWWPRSCCVQGALWVPRAAHLLKLDAPHVVEAGVCCRAGFSAWLYDTLVLWA